MAKNSILLTCLKEVRRANSAAELRAIALDNRDPLLGSPDVAAGLVQAVAGADHTELSVEADLLQVLIEEARIDRENGGALGDGFLIKVEGQIAAMVAEGTMDSDTVVALARCHTWSGVDVPDVLIAYNMSLAATNTSDMEPQPEELGEFLAEMRRELKNDSHGLYTAIGDLLAAISIDGRVALIGHLLTIDDSPDQTLAFYWLFDQSPDIRLAVAEILSDRAAAGTLDRVSARRIVALRSWLPADAARARLDEAIREAQRRELTAKPATAKPPKIDGIYATLPDGAGAQSVAVALGRGAKRQIAMVLVKHGHGIKDAYLIQCKNKAEQDTILAELYALDPVPIPFDAFRTVLQAALAEGLEHGRPAAPGLFMAVEACGLEPLRPEPMTAEDWLAVVDPEREVSDLSAAERNQLSKESEFWPDDFSIVSTWFEDNSEVRNILSSTKGKKKRIAAIWDYLESRRTDWVIKFLHAAHIVRCIEEDSSWRSFVATAAALAGGRSLKTLPIMEFVVLATIEAYDFVMDA